MRRELLSLLRRYATRYHLTPLRLAIMCGTSEPRAWVLLGGPIEQINSETLIDVLARLGVKMELSITSDVPWYVTERRARLREWREAERARRAGVRRRAKSGTAESGGGRSTAGYSADDSKDNLRSDSEDDSRDDSRDDAVGGRRESV